MIMMIQLTAATGTRLKTIKTVPGDGEGSTTQWQGEQIVVEKAKADVTNSKGHGDQPPKLKHHKNL